jgi:hypothetical protein
MTPIAILPIMLLLLAPPPEAAATRISKSDMRMLQKQAETQVKQCWHVPKTRTNIATTIRVHYNPDGTLAGEPDVVSQTIAPEYYVVIVREIAQRAKRAVSLCAPIHLPDTLYSGGWQDIELTLHTKKQ